MHARTHIHTHYTRAEALSNNDDAIVRFGIRRDENLALISVVIVRTPLSVPTPTPSSSTSTASAPSSRTFSTSTPSNERSTFGLGGGLSAGAGTYSAAGSGGGGVGGGLAAPGLIRLRGIHLIRLVLGGGVRVGMSLEGPLLLAPPMTRISRTGMIPMRRPSLGIHTHTQCVCVCVCVCECVYCAMCVYVCVV